MSAAEKSWRTPRNERQAAELLERFAKIEGDLAHIDGVRNRLIAQANANADAASAELLKEKAELLAKLEPWWGKAGPALTQGKRKSIELGGCEVGTRAGADTLGVAGDEKAIAEALAKRPWAEQLIVTTVRLDKRAILKSIDGCHKAQLKALGLSRVPGVNTFYAKRIEQAGTLSEIAA